VIWSAGFSFQSHLSATSEKGQTGKVYEVDGIKEWFGFIVSYVFIFRVHLCNCFVFLLNAKDSFAALRQILYSLILYDRFRLRFQTPIKKSIILYLKNVNYRVCFAKCPGIISESCCPLLFCWCVFAIRPARFSFQSHFRPPFGQELWCKRKNTRNYMC